MSSKEIAKEAFELAEKETREKRVAEVKAIVLKTLEKLADAEKVLKEKQEEKKILRMDLDDLKEGHLDRIAERQAVDGKAKKVSVVVIIKEKETIREVSPWYYPYQVIWQVPYIPTYTTSNPNWQSCGSNTLGILTSTSSVNGMACGGSGFVTINCSVARDNTAGAYNVYGNVVNLR